MGLKTDGPRPLDRYIDQTNFKKIELYLDRNDDIFLPQSLCEIINHRDPTKSVYLVLSEWGYPPLVVESGG